MGFGKHPHHVAHHTIRKNTGKIILAVVAVIIIVAAYAVLSSGSGARQIGQNYTFTLQKGTAQNLALGNGKEFSVYLNYSTPTTAYLQISSIPIFQGMITRIALSKAQTINISLNNSQYSDIELRTVSTNSTNAVLSVVQIPSGIKISTGNTETGTTATTTVSATGGTTSISSTIPTTTANNTVLAVSAFNSTQTGTLINNFGALYRATQSCTPSLYNSTYISTQHSAPSGPNTYYNVSEVTPYNMVYSVADVSPGTYNLTYTTVSKTLGSKPVLKAQFSYPSNVTVSYVFIGIFSGMTYSQVLSAYNSQNSIGNACAALIP